MKNTPINFTLLPSDLRLVGHTTQEIDGNLCFFVHDNFTFDVIVIRNILASLGHKIINIEDWPIEGKEWPDCDLCIKTTMTYKEYQKLPLSTEFN